MKKSKKRFVFCFYGFLFFLSACSMGNQKKISVDPLDTTEILSSKTLIILFPEKMEQRDFHEKIKIYSGSLGGETLRFSVKWEEKKAIVDIEDELNVGYSYFFELKGEALSSKKKRYVLNKLYPFFYQKKDTVPVLSNYASLNKSFIRSPQASLRFIFSQEMNSEAKELKEILTVSPIMEADFKFENAGKELVITPKEGKKWENKKNYSFSFQKSFFSKAGVSLLLSSSLEMFSEHDVEYPSLEKIQTGKLDSENNYPTLLEGEGVFNSLKNKEVLKFVFSEEINKSKVPLMNFSPSKSGQIAWSDSGKTLIWIPDTNWRNHPHVLVIRKDTVEDMNGNTLIQDLIFSFIPEPTLIHIEKVTLTGPGGSALELSFNQGETALPLSFGTTCPLTGTCIENGMIEIEFDHAFDEISDRNKLINQISLRQVIPFQAVINPRTEWAPGGSYKKLRLTYPFNLPLTSHPQSFLYEFSIQGGSVSVFSDGFFFEKTQKILFEALS